MVHYSYQKYNFLPWRLAAHFWAVEKGFFLLVTSRLFLGSGERSFSACEKVKFPYQKYVFLPWRLAGYFWAVEKAFFFV